MLGSLNRAVQNRNFGFSVLDHDLKQRSRFA